MKTKKVRWSVKGVAVNFRVDPVHGIQIHLEQDTADRGWIIKKLSAKQIISLVKRAAKVGWIQ